MVLLHSDRGCQFTSSEYQRFLKAHNVICSMSATGSYADSFREYIIEFLD